LDREGVAQRRIALELRRDRRQVEGVLDEIQPAHGLGGQPGQGLLELRQFDIEHA
jgi:hypothetical protein